MIIIIITSEELHSEMSLLVRSPILGLFVNTLTGNNKYSRHYRENILSPSAM